jgi:hypothetical protein
MLYERPKVNAPSMTKGEQLREWAMISDQSKTNEQLKKLEGHDRG